MRALLVVLIVVLLVFGTKKLRSIGSDLGAAVKGFKKGLAGRETSSAVPVSALPDAEFPEAAPRAEPTDRTSA
jgi:sec-independent protein translocase protein TatA